MKPNDVLWYKLRSVLEAQRKVAPGRSLEISLRGYVNSTLRKSEAQMISVVMLDEGEKMTEMYQ